MLRIRRASCFLREAILKPVITICVILSILMSTALPAYAGSSMWDEIEKYTGDTNLQAEAAKSVSPIIRFAFFIFAILATLGAVIVAFGILKKAIKVKFGKDGFDKRWIVETVAVLVIFIVIGGGAWIQFFKAGQELVVDPATKIITKDYSETKQSSDSNSLKSQASGTSSTTGK